MKHLSPSRTCPVYPRAPTLPVVGSGVGYVGHAAQTDDSTASARWTLSRTPYRDWGSCKHWASATEEDAPSFDGWGAAAGTGDRAAARSEAPPSRVVRGPRSHTFSAMVASGEVTRLASLELPLGRWCVWQWSRLRLVARPRCVYRRRLRPSRGACDCMFHVKRFVSRVLAGSCRRCSHGAAILHGELARTLSTRQYPRSAQSPRVPSCLRLHAPLQSA